VSAPSAQNSNQVGTIGTDSDRVDVNAEDIDAVSVNTKEIGIGSISEGDTTAIEQFDLNNGRQLSRSAQFTNGVDTSNVEIYNGNKGMDGNVGLGAFIVVFGVDQANNSNRFQDVVNLIRGGGVSVINQNSNSTPSSRSYAEADSGLILAMGSGTYDVATIGFSVRVFN